MIGEFIVSIIDLVFAGYNVLDCQPDDHKYVVVCLGLNIKVELPDSQALSGSYVFKAERQPPVQTGFS
jgi:hypothetical protein